MSHVSYSARIALFIGNLVSWLVAYFLFPRIAAFATQGDDTGAGKELGLGMVLVVGLTAPILVLAVIAGADIVRLIYARGAFDEASVLATTAVFVPYAFGTVFMGLRELINRVFFSYQNTITPMVIGALASAANLALAFWFSQQLGLPGIGAAAAISALIFVALQVGVIARWKPELIDRKSLKRILGLSLAALASYGAGIWASDLVANWHFFAPLVGCGAVVGVAYLTSAVLLDRLLQLGLVAELKALKDSNKPDPNASSPDQAPT